MKIPPPTFLRKHTYPAIESVDRSCVQVFWITESGCIIHANDAASASLGYSYKELACMSVWNITPNATARDNSTFADHRRMLRENKWLRYEAFHCAKNGRIYPVERVSNYLEFEG